MSAPLSEYALNRRRFLTTMLASSAVLAFGDLVLPRSARAAASGPFTLPPLPYPDNALSPTISANTIGFHYGKHHQGYVNNLNQLVAGTPLADQPLEAVIKASVGVVDKTTIFNNAAQIWNHTFYWNSLTPGGSKPSSALSAAIDKSFGSFDEFKKKFLADSASNFGSGWTWLVKKSDGSLAIEKTANAAIAATGTPLLVIDVWEHAYYIDYRNLRPKFVEALFGIFDFAKASERFAA